MNVKFVSCSVLFTLAGTGVARPQISECPATCPVTQSYIDVFAPPSGACYTFSAGPFVTASGTGDWSCITCVSCYVRFMISFDGTNCPPPYACLRAFGRSGGAPLDSGLGAKLDGRLSHTAPCTDYAEVTWGAHDCANPAALDVLLFIKLECGCNI